MKDKIPAIIVDLDGTLADWRHRLHLMPVMPVTDCINNVFNEDHFLKFNQAAVNDSLNLAVNQIMLAQNIYWAQSRTANGKIIILTARTEMVKDMTIQWLDDKTILYDKLMMRPRGNQQPAHYFKLGVYERKIMPNYDIKYVIEDDNDCVNMWRNVGVACFQWRFKVDYER